MLSREDSEEATLQQPTDVESAPLWHHLPQWPGSQERRKGSGWSAGSMGSGSEGLGTLQVQDTSTVSPHSNRGKAPRTEDRMFGYPCSATLQGRLQRPQARGQGLGRMPTPPGAGPILAWGLLAPRQHWGNCLGTQHPDERSCPSACVSDVPDTWFTLPSPFPFSGAHMFSALGHIHSSSSLSHKQKPAWRFWGISSCLSGCSCFHLFPQTKPQAI